MHAPIENHCSSVKRMLRYLKGTTDLGLLIRHRSGSALLYMLSQMFIGKVLPPH